MKSIVLLLEVPRSGASFHFESTSEVYKPSLRTFLSVASCWTFLMGHLDSTLTRAGQITVNLTVDRKITVPKYRQNRKMQKFTP